MIQDKFICISLGLQVFSTSREDQWQEIITSIIQYVKNGNKKEYNEKYKRCLFTIWNLESSTSVCFAISKLMLSFSYFFHAPCTILFNVYFYTVRSIFPFLLINHNLKQVLLTKWVIFYFRRRSIIGQLNVQPTTAKKDRNYKFSNGIYIKLQSCSFLTEV